MDQHMYAVIGTRGHWRIVGPNDLVIWGGHEFKSKEAADHLATEFSRAYALGRLTGLQEAEERVKAAFR